MNESIYKLLNKLLDKIDNTKNPWQCFYFILLIIIIGIATGFSISFIIAYKIITTILKLIFWRQIS